TGTLRHPDRPISFERRPGWVGLGALGDLEDALHPGCRVPGDSALVRIGALAQEGDPQRLRLSGSEQFRLPALDLEIVLDLADVLDLEHHDTAASSLLLSTNLNSLAATLTFSSSAADRALCGFTAADVT